jgi:hypothetical protein
LTAAGRRRSSLAALAAALVALALLAWPAGAAGPWRAQLVDAETGQPLEGVVVLALWTKRTADWPHPDQQFHDVDEVVSDAEGRIVIPPRDLSRNTPVQAIVGPEIVMFKSGYGQWSFREAGPRPLLEEPSVREHRAREGWHHLATDGAVVELPRLNTREERLRALPSCQPGLDVPAERIPRWQASCRQERRRLGLR